MNVQLQNQRTALNFETIKRRVGNVQSCEILDKIYGVSQTMFDENFVNTIITLASLSEYNINHFADIVNLRTASLFADFAANTSVDNAKGYDGIFNIYFDAICIGGPKQGSVVKTKICTLLKLTITIPNSTNSFQIKNATASISSSYKPSKSSKSVAACDIQNIIKSSFFEAVQDSNTEKFSYTTWSNNVTMQGPILNMLLGNLVQYQEVLLETSAACGAEIAPFIINTASSKLLYQ